MNLDTFARTALVMMDTRPAFMQRAAASPSYPQLAVALNRLFACRHGYDLLYLHMRKDVCRHQGDTRHPSYCKLAAVAETLARGYGLVVFMDSDAFFQNASQDSAYLAPFFGQLAPKDMKILQEHQEGGE